VRYQKGQGVPQDYKEAMVWYRLAADQGNPEAQFSLGYMYEMGQSVSPDFREAARLYRLAAEQKHSLAQFSLGYLYGEGHGVPRDYVQAYLWFSLAGSGGDAKSIKNRDTVAGKMTPAQIAEAQRLVREWKAKTGQ